MPPTRRRGPSPSAEDLAGLGEAPSPGGRLRKAPSADPVLGVAGSSSTPGRQATRQPAGTATASKAKVGFYQDPHDTARARAAFTWTRAQEGHRSFSDFVAGALMREVTRLEAEYHDGQPWPPMEPGEIPTGKPLGA